MKKQKQDFVLILWSSVDTPLKFRLSFHVFFYLLDVLILLSYLPFLSGINFGLDCVCMEFLFSVVYLSSFHLILQILVPRAVLCFTFSPRVSRWKHMEVYFLILLKYTLHHLHLYLYLSSLFLWYSFNVIHFLILLLSPFFNLLLYFVLFIACAHFIDGRIKKFPF